jgi:hypothetical protein
MPENGSNWMDIPLSSAPEGCNILVMTESGKPVFARYGTDEDTTRICGLLQALRSSIVYNSDLGSSEIQSLQSGSLRVVFLNAGAITLVAICRAGVNGKYATEAYMRLQLEYTYSQILFTLTDQIQSLLQQNASLDLRSLLGSASESATKSLLESAGPLGHPAPFLLGSVSSMFPVPPLCRQRASSALRNAGKTLENTVFGIVFSGPHLLTLVQPDYIPHLMRVSDLHILLHFINRQPALLSSELWLPICLPRFCSSGFLYCYTTCLDVTGKLILAFISSQGATEQFESFRLASNQVRRELGIPFQNGTVLVIEGLTVNDDGDMDLSWTRNQLGDDDYVDVSRDGETATRSDLSSSVSECTFLKDLQASFHLSASQDTVKTYLQSSNARFFFFRYDLPYHVSKRTDANITGRFSQCIVSEIPLDSDENLDFETMMTTFQQLQLRLRFESSGEEAVLIAFSNFARADSIGSVTGNNLESFRSASLMQTSARYDKICYIVEGGLAYIGLSGKYFEL